MKNKIKQIGYNILDTLQAIGYTAAVLSPIIAVGGIISGGIHIASKSNDVYIGDLDSKHIVYEETTTGRNGTEYEMTITEDGRKYILIDSDDGTSVKEVNFGSQKLESMVIDGRHYTAKNQYGESLEDHHTRSVFEKGNRLYNNLRAKIRTELESQHQATEESIPQ